MWEGWGENGGKVVTSFMDDPYLNDRDMISTVMRLSSKDH